MHAGRIGRRLAGRDNCERPGVVLEQRVGVRTTIVRILIVDRGFENSYRALLAKLEVRIGRNRVGLKIISVRLGSQVMRSGAGTGDVVPAWIDIYRLTKVNCDGAVVRNVHIVGARIGTRHTGA